MFTISPDRALMWESAPEEDGDHFQGLGNYRQIGRLREVIADFKKWGHLCPFIVIYPLSRFFPFPRGNERIDKYEDHSRLQNRA